MPSGESRRVSVNAAHERVVPKLRGVSHVVACGVSVVASVVVVVLAPAGRASVAVAVYGIGLVALFGGSALYHRWSGSARLKAVLRRVDHSMIFVFIAASYTPIAVVVLHGWVGWVLLGLAWLGAGIGVAFSMGWAQAPRVIVAGSYLALGWLAVIVIPQLIADLQLTALILVAGGGVLYSAGAVVYVRQRPNLWPRTFGFHELFHLLVILAAAAYYVALIGWMLRATTG
jgi:hemolysin III